MGQRWPLWISLKWPPSCLLLHSSLGPLLQTPMVPNSNVRTFYCFKYIQKYIFSHLDLLTLHIPQNCTQHITTGNINFVGIKILQIAVFQSSLTHKLPILLQSDVT